MNPLIADIFTGIATFTATNVDDLLILTLFFSKVNDQFRPRQIIIGQYLGFVLLLLASLPGFFGSLFIPYDWIRWLGVVPVIFGISYLLKSKTDKEEDLKDVETLKISNNPSFWQNWLSPQIYGVAAITVANGSDNIAIYFTLFASSSWESLLTIICTFLFLVGVWCYAAYRLTKFPAISKVFTGYGNTFVPCVLIGLGVFIVKENFLLAFLALGISCAWVFFSSRDKKVQAEIEN
ncbi:cadmium resistance transporter [Planktothrix agardhii 1806]|uniref:cadmium resistance transporter n=1 Tax=Planktothrix agardhii TaxID=1160 RepID=UPI001F23A00F|nr:cadmium resistance transporter [Planktothrix agardhii]MCF3569370.1 cadmium resistance transporter [Planktothrix agardhii 1805]MCF3584174.1 cadmium resistance transporter [Planktothrix agardhii 1803]MCF3604479.1 cadmium resistance transporter [Planktothrix agardhii 1804]MCF3614715.1 cadmium resistance transporter [Planktothrix agardhii 1806]